MASAKQYRQRAKVCLDLAQEAGEAYAKQAMLELANEFNKAADKLERQFVEGLSSQSVVSRANRKPRRLS